MRDLNQQNATDTPLKQSPQAAAQRIPALYRDGKTIFSVELFPPRQAEGWRKLEVRLPKICAQRPDFVSVTCGAGGGPQQGTLEVCTSLKQQGQEVLAHSTCLAQEPAHLEQNLTRLRELDVRNILALRGDPPRADSSGQAPASGGGFRYASELVRFLRAQRSAWNIGVAGYPEGHVEAASYTESLQHQIDKLRAGGEFIISQFFTENACFLRWRDDLARAGEHVPVVAGVLPAISAKQIARFASFCGTSLAPPLMKGLESLADDPQGAEAFGLEYALRQIEDLLQEGVAGIHLYALNRVRVVEQTSALLRSCCTLRGSNPSRAGG